MALDSLLASLKSGVAEVTEVQVSRNRAFANNPTTCEKVAEATPAAAEIHTATPETLVGKSEVTSEPAPIEDCTHETSVTPKTIKCRIGAGDTATASRWWLIHYLDCDPVEVCCCPEARHADILEQHPHAVAAEPITPAFRQPKALLSAEEEWAVLTWLSVIGETDPAIIADVMGSCEQDADSRMYFLRRAREGSGRKSQLSG